MYSLSPCSFTTHVFSLTLIHYDDVTPWLILTHLYPHPCLLSLLPSYRSGAPLAVTMAFKDKLLALKLMELKPGR